MSVTLPLTDRARHPTPQLLYIVWELNQKNALCMINVTFLIQNMFVTDVVRCLLDCCSNPVSLCICPPEVPLSKTMNFDQLIAHCGGADWLLAWMLELQTGCLPVIMCFATTCANVHFCTCIPLDLFMDFFIEHFCWTYFIALLLLDFFTLLLDLLNINPSCHEFTLTVTTFCSFYVIVFFTRPIAHRRGTISLCFGSSGYSFDFILFPYVLSVLLLFF